MQVMSIYIILGVGADNILVFAETWKQSRAQCEDEGADSGERRSGSLESRLEWTWPRATRAVSITSLITVCSFLLTNFTDVPLVSTFGSFVAIALSWNYLLVITLFPACVVLHERYVVQRGRGERAARCCGCLWPLCSHQGVTKAERFLQDTWYGLLRKREVRWCVLVVMPLIALLGAVLASQKVQLSKRSMGEIILYQKHPLQKTLDFFLGFDPVFPAMAAFYNGGGGSKDVGHWAYGLDSKDAIDRSGTNPLANLNPTKKGFFEETRGVSRFNGQNLTSVAFQSKILEDCRAMGRLSSVVQGEVYCFMHDLQMYLESRGRRFPVPSATLVSELRAWTSDLDCKGVGCFQDSMLYTSGTGFLVCMLHICIYMYVRIYVYICQKAWNVCMHICIYMYVLIHVYICQKAGATCVKHAVYPGAPARRWATRSPYIYAYMHTPYIYTYIPPPGGGQRDHLRLHWCQPFCAQSLV